MAYTGMYTAPVEMTPARRDYYLNPPLVPPRTSRNRGFASSEPDILVPGPLEVFFAKIYDEVGRGGGSTSFLTAVEVAATPWATYVKDTLVLGSALRNKLAATDAAVGFADRSLRRHGGSDPHGLTRDQIAAIHLYTQETEFYKHLNKLLRETSDQATNDKRSNAECMNRPLAAHLPVSKYQQYVFAFLRFPVFVQVTVNAGQT